MGKVSYSIYEVPDLQGDEQAKTYQARINTAGVINTKQLCHLISERSSLSSADIKGALDSFHFYLKQYLSQGYNIHLDELGIFSLGLKSERIRDAEKGDSLYVRVKDIHFRPCSELKEKIKSFQLSYQTREKKVKYTKKERLSRILDYTKKNRYIERTPCETLNNVSAFQANADLQLLVSQNELEPVGSGRNRSYILSNKQG